MQSLESEESNVSNHPSQNKDKNWSSWLIKKPESYYRPGNERIMLSEDERLPSNHTSHVGVLSFHIYDLIWSKQGWYNSLTDENKVNSWVIYPTFNTSIDFERVLTELKMLYYRVNSYVSYFDHKWNVEDVSRLHVLGKYAEREIVKNPTMEDLRCFACKVVLTYAIQCYEGWKDSYSDKLRELAKVHFALKDEQDKIFTLLDICELCRKVMSVHFQLTSMHTFYLLELRRSFNNKVMCAIRHAEAIFKVSEETEFLHQLVPLIMRVCVKEGLHIETIQSWGKVEVCRVFFEYVFKFLYGNSVRRGTDLSMVTGVLCVYNVL